MLEQAMLRERFEALLEQEQQALAAYEKLIDRVGEGEPREQVEQLCRDKRRHVELVQRLLEIVE